MYIKNGKQLFGKFLTKLIPFSKLTSAFLFEQIELIVQAITSVPVDVKDIIFDGN